MRCTICLDPRVQEVDALLAGGRSARSLAAEFGLSPDAMKRHARSHAAPPTRVPRSTLGEDPLTELVDALRERALSGGNPAVSREYRLALAAQAERGVERPTYDVLSDPEWLRLRTILFEALADEPAARLKVAAAIRAYSPETPPASRASE